MANILTIPESGIFFDGNTAGTGIAPILTGDASGVAIQYDGYAGVEINSSATGVNYLDRFSVEGANGRLFGVTDEVTGTVFSVNDAAGLPIVEVESTSSYDKITLGEYGSDLLVLSGQNTIEITGSQIASQSWVGQQGFLTSETDDQNLNEVLAQGNTSSYGISVNQITGTALTIDTDTLFVDSTNNRVGIGTTSPSEKLDVVGDVKIKGSADFYNTSNQLYGRVYSDSEGLTFDTVANRHTRFYKQGVETMRIDTSGNVGIGTTSPTAPLTFGKSVYGGTSSENFFRIKFKDNGGIQNDVGIGQSDVNSLEFNKCPAGIFSFNDGTNGEVMRINASGNVGIGTTSPSQKLDVNGVGSFVGGTVAGVIDTQSAGIYLSTTGRGLSANFSGYARNLINHLTGGIIEIGQSTSLINHIKINAGSSGTNGIVTLLTKGAERMRITADGNVGIGTTSPTADLYINSSNNVGLTLEHASRPTIQLTDGTNSGYVGLDSGSSIITGTSDNDLAIRSPRNIVFGGNSIARMSITNAGNVGIGTTSPSHKLEVGLTSTVALANQPAEPLFVSNNAQSVDGRVFISVKHDVVNTASAVGAGFKMTAAAVTSGTASYDDSLIFLRSAGSSNDTVHSAPKAIKFYVDNHATNAGSGANYNDLGDLALTIGEAGGSQFGATSYQGDMNGGKADLSVDCGGTSQISWVGDYFQVGGTDLNYNMRATAGLIDTWSQDLTIRAGNTGTTSLLRLGTNGQTSTIVCNNGDVGIGTTTPAEKLELFSASDVALRIHKSSVGEFRMGVAGSASSDTVQFVTNTNGFDFRGDSNTFPDGGSSRLFISSTGNVDIGSVFAFDTSTDRLTITNNQNTGGINLSGGNSRIYFGGYRAIEGDQSGGTLYIGEGYGTISLMDDVAVSGDATVSGALNINGINQHASTRYTLPSNNVSFTRTAASNGSDQWFKIYSGGGSTTLIRLSITSGGDNTQSRDEFLISVAGYGFKHHVQRLPAGRYNGSKLLAIATTNPSAGGTVEIWVKLYGMVSGSASTNIFANAGLESSSNILSSATGTAPTITSNGTQLDISATNRNETTIMASRGATFGGKVGIGTTSPSSILEVVDSSTSATNRGIIIRNTSSSNDPDFRIGVGYSGMYDDALTIFKDSAILQYLTDQGTFFTQHIGIATSKQIKAFNSGLAYLDIYNGSANTELSASTDLIFKTTGAERVRIKTSSGNVGIGTDNPDTKLHVVGSNYENFTVQSTSSGYAPASVICEAGNSNTRGAGIFMHNTVNDRIWYAGTMYNDNSNAWNLSYNSDASALGAGRTSMAQNSYSLFTVTNTGSVGIGTTSPNHKLDIYSNENVPLRIHRPSNANLDSSGAWGIGFSTRGDAVTSTTDTRAGIFSYYNGNLFLAANSTSIVSDPDAYARLTVAAAGNVGIGITSPSQKLDINGNLLTRGDIVSRDTYPSIYVDHSGTVMGGIRADATTKLEFKTLTTAPLSFQVNSSEKMLITSAGNVGIGTNSPTQRLHVSGGHILLDNNQQVRFKDSGGTERTIVQLDSSNDLSIGGSYAGALKFIGGGSYTEQMRVHDNGNVGIGTTGPDVKLHVGTGSGATGDSGYQIVADSAGIAGVQILAAATQSSRVVFGDSGDNDIGMIKYDHTNDSMSFRTNATTALTIDSSQNATFAGAITANGNIVTTSASQIIASRKFSALNTSGVMLTDSGASNGLSIANGGNATFTHDLTVSGDLTVNGTTTTINSTTVQVDDKNIELGTVGSPTDVTADGGGITLKGATDKTINWISSTDSWTFNKNVSAPSITIADNATVSGDLTVSTDFEAASTVTFSSLTNAGSDVDKFLVSNSGDVQFRTGAEVLSDIGGITDVGGKITKKISGDGTATTFTVTHSFGTPHVMTQLLHYGDNGTGATYEVVNTTVKRNSDNAIDVVFGVAPTTTEDYLVLITKMPAIS